MPVIFDRIVGMEIKITLVNFKDKEVLRALINDYQKGILKSEKPEEYKYLGSYWQKPDRYAYFIEVDGKIAGFVLVNNYNLVEMDAKNISEFYIKPEFRKKGVGKMSSKKVFDLFPGKWEVRELESNPTAQKFWRNVIAEYTDNNYKEVILDNEKWHGPVQTFNLL